ncbi:MAG: proline racemase family protein [Planctomycetota bacterium]|nr:proline racemase family protein [Planctomycetota bacterium]
MTEVEIVDSHTGGEPTRVVVGGAPDLGNGPLVQRREIFRREHEEFRSALLREPRGNDVIVGALLCEPADPDCDVGVIYFNNVGCIGMCGHGTIGLVTTLYDLGRIQKGVVKIDTPVGPVQATLHADHTVSVQNVVSYRYRADVEIDVQGLGAIKGDIAWGGNWFFLVNECPERIHPDNLSALLNFTGKIRNHLDIHAITGADQGQIDHVEVFGPGTGVTDSKNFVLCPGGEFDRSPCGTGTSAKVACLHADGKLKPGDVFRQESIIGSVFEASIVEEKGGGVIPTIRGQAHVHAVSVLRMEPNDPFRLGIEL